MKIVEEVSHLVLFPLPFKLAALFPIKSNTTILLSTALVIRLYEYLCVMSTIPTLNPALGTNINSKSKTTLNSGGNLGGNMNTMALRSNRAHISPYKAEKSLLASEISRMGKDETR